MLVLDLDLRNVGFVNFTSLAIQATCVDNTVFEICGRTDRETETQIRVCLTRALHHADPGAGAVLAPAVCGPVGGQTSDWGPLPPSLPA